SGGSLASLRLLAGASGSERLRFGKQKPPQARGFFYHRQSPYFFSSVFRKPENFFWNRDTRPPRSRICCWPPAQAGCDFGSMSRCRTSPSLPHVERVVNSLPSVITTLMV